MTAISETYISDLYRLVTICHRLGGTLKDVIRKDSNSGLLYGREPSQLMFALHKKLTRFQNGYFKGMVPVNLIVQSVLDFCGMYCNEILFTHERLMLFGNIKEQYTGRDAS